MVSMSLLRVDLELCNDLTRIFIAVVAFRVDIRDKFSTKAIYMPSSFIHATQYLDSGMSFKRSILIFSSHS